jgi:hypothetical protein
LRRLIQRASNGRGFDLSIDEEYREVETQEEGKMVHEESDLVGPIWLQSNL